MTDNQDPHRRPTPWTKHSDPLSPSSLAPLVRGDDDLQQAAKDMFGWTQSDRPIEESIGHMKRIVDLCQDEASWSGNKRWKQVIATYKSCRATTDAVQDLLDAREPFWTQSRVKHASTTLATPRALADSIRIMVAESERANGHYLDREARHQLMQAVERVFPHTQPVILVPDSPDQPVSASTTHHQLPVAPVAQMTKIDKPSPVPAAPQQTLSATLDPRLASRLPGWAPPTSEKDMKSRTDSVADSPSSRKSSAATLVISSPQQPPLNSLVPDMNLSQVIKPTRPSRFVPGDDLAQHAILPSPSASPSLVTAPIQFNIATGSNQAPLHKRPRLSINSDVKNPVKPVNNVFSPPPSERRGSSALSTTIQPPTGPRSLPLFQAKIMPKGFQGRKPLSKKEILEACDYNRVSAQDVTLCPSDYSTWLLHFKTFNDLQASLGKITILRGISIPVLTYAPGRSFQVFGIAEKSSFITPQVEMDMISTIARTFHPRTFIMRRQKRQQYNARLMTKWLVVFEEPLDRENIILDMKINGIRETLELFGMDCSEEVKHCWVCLGTDHHAPSCANFTEVVKLPHNDRQYLWKTPQLK
ncbi:unnamed protein product [Aureobasidium uvarum]|uniref:Uncharacterized protein n=1 Tax=Aureobasidium uvarum TaxID=2773716 RepID=A0A9N8KGS8_9PEZI|nr:unnamed protein product [Aureobasidium uvarum]